MTQTYSPRQVCSKHVLFDLEENLTSGQVRSRSGQGQIMTQIGQYGHPLKRLDEPSRLAPFARHYLHPVVTYWRKMDCTSFDLR